MSFSEQERLIMTHVDRSIVKWIKMQDLIYKYFEPMDEFDWTKSTTVMRMVREISGDLNAMGFATTCEEVMACWLGQLLDRRQLPL